MHSLAVVPVTPIRRFQYRSERGGAFGDVALFSNTSADNNTTIGFAALFANTIGGNNTAIGQYTPYNSTGDGNTAFGSAAGAFVTTASNVICIGSSDANVDNSCFIGEIRGRTTANNDAIPVLIDSAGQLGAISSSRRFKKRLNR